MRAWVKRHRFTAPPAWLAVAFVVAVPALAFAGHEASNVAQYTGCLNKGGNISDLAVGTEARSPCSASQTQVHLSGGDITAVVTPSDGGLEGGSENGAASVRLQPSYKLPQTCSGGEVAKWNGSTWACGSAARSGQSCPSGQFATGVDASGTLACDPPAAPKLSVARVDDSTEVPFAGGALAAAQCPPGYKLIGGGWGTRDAIADGADVFDYDGGSDTYDVGAGTANPFGGRVYARAYCIRVE
jgi:hypothetical protein